MHENFQKLQVSIDFSNVFNNFASFAPEPPTNAYSQNFLNFSLNFRESFVTIFEKFSNNLEISLKIYNSYKIVIDF